MILPAHVLATLAYRRWCWSRSTAVFVPGKRGALLRLLGDLPCFFC
jgi:hypothetical protein